MYLKSSEPERKKKDEIDTQEISREFLPIPHTQDQRLID